MKDRGNIITTSELAKLLGISRVAVFKKIENGEIEAKKVGRGYAIDKENLPADIKRRINEEIKSTGKKAIERSKSDKDIDFEAELWRAADKLRGNIDVSEYKHIVLGLLFLKYVSDSFYKRREQLEEMSADPKNKDFYVKDEKSRESIIEGKEFYKSDSVFYIPEKARWEHLRTQIQADDLGKILDKAMDLIEEENVELEGVLPKVFTRTNLDKSVLSELVNIFSRINFDHNFDREKDILGRVYEYFLGQFASAEGKRGGEFFSPKPIVKLLVEILEPFENARIFDPAAGSGGMFVTASEYLREHGENQNHLAIYGQEFNQTTLRLCKMNLAIRGVPGDIKQGNSYTQDQFPDLRADFVLANPPFNADWDPKALADNDPRIKFGLPPGSNANFMWIQHFIHHLAPNGMAGFVMANGALAVGGREGKIREKIIEKDLIDVVIACPPKLFYNVALPVSLWFIAKDKKGDRFRGRSGETLFIDAREIYEQIDRRQVKFTDEQIQKIANTVRAWRGEEGAGKYKDVPGFCKSSDLKEIKKAGYVLTPGRYVGLPEEEDDGIPFEEKMEKLTKELKEAFKKGDELEKEIIMNLKLLNK